MKIENWQNGMGCIEQASRTPSIEDVAKLLANLPTFPREVGEISVPFKFEAELPDGRLWGFRTK